MSSKQSPSLKKIAMIVLVVTLSVILAVMLAFTVWAHSVLGNFSGSGYNPNLTDQQKEDIQNDKQGSTIDPNAETIRPDDLQELDTTPIEKGSGIYNILLVGQDRRPGENVARTDSMILVTVNTNNNTVIMTSIMRDMYVKIPGYRANRINVSYALGGVSLLYETLEYNFGIRPDKFVEVDFNQFEEIIELVGGVHVTLTEQEAKHLNHNEDFYGYPDESWNLKPGMNLLNGRQALAYSRIRKVDGTGDFGRTNRQRNVLESLMSKAAELNLAEINSFLVELGERKVVTTDMTPAEMLMYAAKFYPVLTNMNLKTQGIPFEGAYYDANEPNVGMVLVPNLDKIRPVLEDTQK